jgi:hypothetical protein
MKNKILTLIEKHPKYYTKLIKKDLELMQWINVHTLIQDIHLPAMIYSAVYQETNICKNGNVKKFNRFSAGFQGCGPAAICKCTKENIATNVAITKQNYTSSQLNAINDARAKTMLEKYGCEYNSQRADLKHIWARPKIPMLVHEKLTDYEWLNNEYNVKQRSLSEIADELNVYYSTVGDYCQRFGFTIRPTSLRSLTEIAVSNYIKSLGVNVIDSDRSIISPKEIDIYIPSASFGIEINGLRWHSHHPTSGKQENRNKHLQKTTSLSEKNIQLMHITDYEWANKTDIIKSMIGGKLGLNQKIAARKCEVGTVSKDEEKKFLNINHLQGAIPSNICVGLYYNKQLVMLMSLGKSRFKKDVDYEVLRMCSALNFTVVGGVSKLVNKIKKLCPASTIVSYCDLSKSNGGSYIKAGFTKLNQSKPGYFWTDGNVPISRYRCQKKKLKSWLLTFDPTLSESINMFNAGYRRYWDCGNAVLLLKT